MASTASTRRTLPPAPASFVDGATGAPAFGAYAGPLPRVVLPASPLASFARRKRWVYVAVTTEETFVAAAVVRTGYAATAFAFVFDRRSGAMLADETKLAPAALASVADDPHAEGVVARFRSGLTMTRTARGLDVSGRLGAIAIDASFDATRAPPAIAAVAKLAGGDGLVSATEKRVLLAADGAVKTVGRTIRLAGGVAGYDYTHGLMPRHTRWRWAFALGADAGGAPIAFNVVEGFVGAAECAAFRAGEAIAISEPRFAFDAADPMRPWTLRGDGDDALDLTFTPGAVHAQRTNLGLVRSRFVQPVGTFDGVIRLAGHERRVANLAGVVEDQDVLW